MADNAARRPRWPFVAFAVLLALAALLVPVFPRPHSAGIRARFDRIENGMTEQQVEKLLGGPRGVYDKGRRYTTTTAAGWGAGGSHLSWWYFPDCTIEVDFDNDHRVTGKRIELLPPQSLLERAVRWGTSPSP